MGLEWMCFTEHNVLRYREAREAGRKYGVAIIPGIELTFKTGRKFWFWEEQYHAIILGVEEEPPKNVRNSLAEVYSWAKEQDCFVVAPHPFSIAGMKERARKNVDAIEIHNSLLNPSANFRAKVFCKKSKKIPIAGSDSHSIESLGNVLVEVDSGEDEDDILQALKKGKLEIKRKRYNSFSLSYKILREKYRANFNSAFEYIAKQDLFGRTFGLELLNSVIDDKFRTKALYSLAYLLWQVYDSFYHSSGLIKDLLFDTSKD
jgi:predicted metal-dependent phosphoesterase TrpH